VHGDGPSLSLSAIPDLLRLDVGPQQWAARARGEAAQIATIWRYIAEDKSYGRILEAFVRDAGEHMRRHRLIAGSTARCPPG